jgi:hypothetical protein
MVRVCKEKRKCAIDCHFLAPTAAARYLYERQSNARAKQTHFFFLFGRTQSSRSLFTFHQPLAQRNLLIRREQHACAFVIYAPMAR